MQDGRERWRTEGEKLEKRAYPQIHNTKKSYILTANQFTLLFTIRWHLVTRRLVMGTHKVDFGSDQPYLCGTAHILEGLIES